MTEIKEEINAEGTVPMGTFLGDDEAQQMFEQAVKEEKDENAIVQFKEFCNDKPYLVFDKAGIAHFMDLVSYHSRLGYDNYTLSFKIDLSGIGETGKVSLVYNNGNVLAISDVPVVSSNVPIKSCIVSVDTMLKIFSASRGYIFLFEDESSLYGYIFGGKVYLETFRVETDICAKDHLVDQLSSKAVSVSKVGNEFVATLKHLYDIVRTGSRVEEKAIYFEHDGTYIYSGIVMGKFPGIGVNITLQDIDISSLSRFFFDVQGSVDIEDHGVFMRFVQGSRSIYLAKRGLKLSDDMKYSGIDTKSGVAVDVSGIKTIVNFLINMANNTGILQIQPSATGISLVCFQKAMDYNSAFRVRGAVEGDGISEVRVPLDILKTFLKVFGSQVQLKTSGNKLYISGQEGRIVVFGNL